MLQDIQGLVLQFQSVANQCKPDGKLRAAFDEVLDRAEAVLVDGRIRLRRLYDTLVTSELAPSLIEFASLSIDGSTPRFRLQVEGIAHPMPPFVTSEMRRIGEEAIRNALRHAQATYVDVLIRYERGGVRLTVLDDGVGYDAQVLESRANSGHYGLVDMRERADCIGAALSVGRGEPCGVKVMLFVPRGMAHGRRGRRLTSLLMGPGSGRPGR